jgi:uroporphyrinogen-III synthase
VSANAVEGLEHALGHRAPLTGSRDGVRVAAVGTATAGRARELGWSGVEVPEEEDARGLLDHLAAVSFDGATVWIPAGDRRGSATELLPGALTARGARVQVLGVYTTRTRIPEPPELERLDRSVPGAVVIHSGSSAEAVYAADAPAAFRRWREAPVVAIGAASSRICRRLTGRTVMECASPADGSVREALERIPALHPERKES